MWALLLAACFGGASKAEPDERPVPERRRPAPASSGWQHVPIRDAKAREAVCNNGEGANFFVRPGASKNDWVVFLEGGGLCSNLQECRERNDRRKMPSPARRPLSSEGIFSTDPAKNPDFHDWNAVFVPYCSSDFWLGDSAPSDATGGLAFRGARIVDAVVEDLKAGAGGLPPLTGAKTLLFVGGSAGSVGVRHHLDNVAEGLPGVRVLGLADSAFEPWKQAKLKWPDEGRVPDQQRLWKPRLDSSCVAAASVPRCLDLAFSLEHVETPLFVYMDQFDTNAFERAKIATRDCAEADRFSAAVRDGLRRFDGSFSTRAGIHVLSIKDNFSDLQVGDPATRQRYSFAQVLGNWVFDRSGPKHVAAPER